MGMLVLVAVLMAVSVGICAGAVWIGARRPDAASPSLILLYRQLGLPNPELLPDWPQRQFEANRRELGAIADYLTTSRRRP